MERKAEVVGMKWVREGGWRRVKRGGRRGVRSLYESRRRDEDGATRVRERAESGELVCDRDDKMNGEYGDGWETEPK